MGVKTLLTVDEFLELPQVKDDDYRRYELWHGELVEMAETIPLHNWIRDELSFRLRLFLTTAKLGVVLVETGVRLDSNTLFRPDVVFWDAQHWAAVNLRKSGVDVLPQLVVEVQSPSERRASLVRKAEDYIRAGIPVVWVFLEDPFEVLIFEAGRPQRRIGANGILEAPSILPGFSLVPSQLLPPAGPAGE
jgi:Uma2 family endonuclease